MKNVSSTEQSCMCLKYLLFCCEIKYLFKWKRIHNKNASFQGKGKLSQHFHIMFKIQTAAGNSNYSRKQMHNTSMSFHKKICQTAMGKNAIWIHPISTFRAGILYKQHFSKYRAPDFSKRLIFGIATNTKKTRGTPTWKFSVLDSEVFIGYRAEKKNWKKLEENQKTKETKKMSWEKCCA